MSENYQQIIIDLIERIPEITGIMILDINANIIAFKVNEDLEKILDPIAISTGVAYLSILKLVDHFKLNSLDQFYLRGSDGYLLTIQVDVNRLLLVRTTLEVKLGLIFLDTTFAVRKISKIPYIMPIRKISLEKKLEEIEDEIQEKYKIFFSYAKSDSSKFKIKEIAEFLENNFPNVEIMYFEKSKKTGEDILDYMERGVNWCNIFIWFHSPESMKSEAVKKEYKMAVYLGKNVITITEDFNSLPLSARVTWALLFNENIEETCNQIMNDITNYDIKSAKQEW